MAEQTLERHQGDYVPDYTPGPVAAGGTGTLETPAPDYDRARHLVPSERQRVHGHAPAGPVDAEFDRLQADQVVGRETRRQVVSRYANAVNPWRIEAPKIFLFVFGMQALLGGWDEGVLGLAQPEIAASFGVSVASMVWVSALSTQIPLLFGLLMGYIVDRVRRVTLVRIGGLVHVLGTLARLFAPSWGLYGGATLGTNLVASQVNAAQTPMMFDAVPSSSRMRAQGFFTFMRQVSGLIALPVTGFLVLQVGWRAAVLVLVIPSVLVALMSFFLKEPVRGGMDRLELGVSAEQAAVEPPPPSMQEALRAAWAVRTLRFNVLASFVVGFATPLTTVMTFVSADLYGLDPFQRSLVHWIGTLAAIPMGILAVGLTQRLLLENPGKIMMLAAGASVLVAVMMLFPLLHPPLWLYIVVELVRTQVPILALITATFITVQSVPARYRGVAMQIGTPFLFVSGLLAPVVYQSAAGLGLLNSIVVFLPFQLAAGAFYLASAGSVARDIRSARAGALAEEESAKAKAARQNKLLVCRDVDLLIDEVQILSHVDLDVREGEILALVGTNGAGKSTLLRTICGLQPASNGAIFFDGEDCTFRPTHESARDGIVYMPGGQGVFPLMTVRDNLHTAAWMQRKDEAAVHEGVERVLEMFPRLRERLDAQAGAMSGGEQQMLAVGQAFLMEPKLLMIDELSLGLAPAIVEQLLDTLREMRDEGVTIILVEQSLNVALTVADRAVFMEKGEIRFDGPTEELLARPDLVRSVFMGGAGGGAVTASRRRAQSALDDRESLLRCDDVSISFGGVAALADVDLEVAAGEIVGIIGPNGAGKTTLFDVFSGYLTPDSGSIHLGDRDVSRLSPDARARLGLGRAFQNARLFPSLTVRENIAVALERRAAKSSLLAAVWAPPVRRSERKLYSRVDGFIELLGLTAYADKFVRELSTGTRRAVEVACQMAAEPKVLLLDEPSSGLAQAEAEALGPALARIVKETGCGMLLIEHDLNLISRVSDRLVAMELGRVVTSGTPDQVLRDPRVLQSYLAASSDVIDRSGSRIGSVLAAVVDDLPAPASPDQTTSS